MKPRKDIIIGKNYVIHYINNNMETNWDNLTPEQKEELKDLNQRLTDTDNGLTLMTWIAGCFLLLDVLLAILLINEKYK